MRCIRSLALDGVLLSLLSLGIAGHVWAQSGTSSALAGTITDSSGAVVASATVSAVEVDAKANRNGLTDAAGRFLFSQINRL